MNYTKSKQISGLIMHIDFEKAFDSDTCKFIFQTLDYLNFGKLITKWIEVLYMHYTEWHNI